MEKLCFDEKMMNRCLELALNGLGNTTPNPLVGSVITYNNQIIGEGYHACYGQPHAEVNAIDSVKDKELLKQSTLYVNLEPCSHHGKTPPCADLIIKMKIPKVVIGNIDCNDKVCGKGIAILKENGCEIVTGILENDCRFLNRRFFTFHQKKRPYIILKWAESKDGFIDIVRENNNIQPTQITGNNSKILVHKWRTEESAIMVATNTALKDNPSLTSREWFGNNPVRVVIDRQRKIPVYYNIYDNKAETYIFNEIESSVNDNIKLVKVNFNEDLIKNVLETCYKNNLQSIIIEGGAILLNSFINNDIWDEARVFTSPNKLIEGIKAPDIKQIPYSEYLIDKDNLSIYFNN